MQKLILSVFALIVLCATAVGADISVTLVTSGSTAGQFVPAANGGAVNATKAQFHFQAIGGSFVVTEMKFAVTGRDYPVTAVSVGGTTATPVNGTAYLVGLNLVVPNGGAGLYQDVFVSYSEVGVNGTPSGSTAGIILTYIKYVSRETAQVSTLIPNLIAPTMKLVGSRPTLALSPSSSELVVGLVEVGKVTVSADPKGDITINQLPISVVMGHDVTFGNGIVVKDQNGNPVATTNTAFFSVKAGDISTITFTGGYIIPAGISQTFGIFLQFTSVGFSSVDGSPPYAYLSLGSPDLFSWTDTAGGSSTHITEDNKLYLYNYPPTVVSSFAPLRITSFSRMDGSQGEGFIICVAGQPDAPYTIQVSDRVSAPWTNLTSSKLDVGGIGQISISGILTSRAPFGFQMGIIRITSP